MITFNIQRLAMAFAMCAVVLAMPASPQAQAQSTNFQPVALTEASASQAIAALPDVFEVARKYEGSGVDPTGDDPLAGLANLATYAAAQADLTATVASHGFASYQDWMMVMQTVMQAYAFIQSEGAMQQMAPAMDAMMQQVLNNPSIPQAQKDMIIAQMGNGGPMAQMQAGAPSPGNRAIVEALAPQIQQMINYMQQTN